MRAIKPKIAKLTTDDVEVSFEYVAETHLSLMRTVFTIPYAIFSSVEDCVPPAPLDDASILVAHVTTYNMLKFTGPVRSLEPDILVIDVKVVALRSDIAGMIQERRY